MGDKKYTELNPKANSRKGEELKEFITSQLIGHEKTVNMFVDAYEVALSNDYLIQNSAALIEDERKELERPVITATLLGPSGVGKTYMARLIARFLINTYVKEFALIDEPIDIPRNMIHKIECASYNTQYEMSRILGASPGYLGSDKIPMLDQRNIDNPSFKILRRLAHRISSEAAGYEKQIRMLEDGKNGMQQAAQINDQNELIYQEEDKFKTYLRENLGIRIWSVILLDEIEKGHHSLHDFLLEAVEEGQATMANGRITSFRDSIIILTSNAGSKAIKDNMRGKVSLGFAGSDKNKEDTVYHLAMKEFKKIFKTELIGRLNEAIHVLRPLTEEEMRQTIRMQLNQKIRSLKIRHEDLIAIAYTPEFFDFLFKESTDHPEYGVRQARAKINKYVVGPVTKIIASKQVVAGDQILLHVKLKNGKIKPQYLRHSPPQEKVVVQNGTI